MVNVVLVAGLPGSGKSWLLRELENAGSKCFDDFKREAIKNCARFPYARSFTDLICDLRQGLDCAVSDIDFCRGEAREEAESFLEALVPGAERTWIFFENNSSACREALLYRQRTQQRDAGPALEKLAQYAPLYSVPEGVRVRPVWHPHRDAPGDEQRAP